ncbi:hypothetical protein PVAP13_8KG170502 [Panicum virgatum]|uniref:NB-ARC domain-containing protein n=1 Tax=Panicum virgatum TaxID=38727 RepID=A0A8T0PJ74_PANVG|nr:hypothetical protein PVAP13_8KG170502 [Panicum virgatum]
MTSKTSRDASMRFPKGKKDAAKLVGIDGPTQKLIDLLTRVEGVKKQKLRVVSIVGVGGLGKTTIANSVYERLRGQFESHAFVSVSLKPDMKQILSSILRQVSKDKCTNAGEKDRDELLRSIRDFLVNKRYLIVIDDVWNVEAWEIIKCALIDKNVGSRVIVTTRKMDVAKFSSMDGELYELDPLSEKDSRRLLCKRIFNEDVGIHSDLEEVTMKILKKCGGIPLAIITIASMLASMPRTKYEWYGVHNSMGSGLETDKTLDKMRNILHLSYSELPFYLKPCLLYLSMFPEDFEIRINDLVRLWLAEGFIYGKQGSNLYDIGEKYFNELVNRSMIQLVEINEFGVAKTCRVHDMILDLIISLSTQENFAIILDGSHLKSTMHSIRRISLHDKVDGNREDSKEEQIILPTTVSISHARSLVVLGNAVQLMPPLSWFSVLRVLCLKNVPSKVIHPKDLGSLHHLRYLELGGEVEPGLLEGIGNLKLLKTLNLKLLKTFNLWGPSIEELPTSIVELQGLEHLLMDKRKLTGLKLPDGIGNLTSLQELSGLDVNNSPSTLTELGKLTELRTLALKGLGENESYMKTFLQSLSNLGNLRTLEFYSSTGTISLDNMSDQWRGPVHLQSFNGGVSTFFALPRWFSSLSELSCLFIRVNVLRQVDLQLLGALPVLRILYLQAASRGVTEERLAIGGDQSFRSLAKFRFMHYSSCWLVFGPGAMPKLQSFGLYLEAQKTASGGIDVGWENLTSLKHVTVTVDCDGARARKVEDVETRIRDVVGSHPNHPTLELSRVSEQFMT